MLRKYFWISETSVNDKILENSVNDEELCLGEKTLKSEIHCIQIDLVLGWGSVYISHNHFSQQQDIQPWGIFIYCFIFY